jgi:peptide/nickel transport system permease protein
MATLDFGVSLGFNTPVSDLVRNRLPVTLVVLFYSLVLSLIIAIPLGVFSAYRAGSSFDRASSTVAFGLLSVPSYIIGVVLLYFFAVKWGWFPAISKDVSLFQDPVKHFKAYGLPVITLTVAQIAIYMRLLRTDMLATLQMDFITMARAKGMSTRHILFRHALRPSLFSLITAAAVNVGTLIGGAVIVEQIFALNGMGQLTVEAIGRRDFPVVQVCVTIFAVGFVFVNFLVDIAYAFIDPRIRHARALA